MNPVSHTVNGWFIAVVVLIGTTLSIGAALWVAGEQRREDAAQLAQVVTAYSSGLGFRIHELNELVEFTERLFVSSDQVTREEFRTFAERVLIRHPEIRAIQWLPRVSGERRARFEARVGRDSGNGFRIVERNPRGEIVPAGARGVYFPLLFVESPRADDQVAGFDLASAPSSRRVLNAATVSGETVISGRILLSHEREPRFGLWVVRPVYRGAGGAPATESRRTELLGAVACAVSVDRLLATVVREVDVRGLTLELVDDTGDSVFSRAPPRAPRRASYPASNSAGGVTAPVEVAGREWTLRLTPVEGGASLGGGASVAGGAALAGLLLTAMLGAYLQRMRREGERHLRGTRELAREVAERKEAEQELRLAYSSLAHFADEVQQRREALRSIVDALPYPLYVIDADSYVVRTANVSAEEQGLREGGICHRALWGFEQPCDLQRPGRQCPISRVREEGEACVVEDSYGVTGGSRTVDFHSTPVFDPEGRLREVIVSAIDVTGKRRARERTEYLAFQAGVAEMGTALLHNIGNAVMGISHRAATLEGKSRELRDIGTILNDARSHLAREVAAGEPSDRATEAALALVERVGSDLVRMADEVFTGDAKGIRTGVENIAESIRVHRDTVWPRPLSSEFSVGELVAEAAVIQSDALDEHDIALEVWVEEGLEAVVLPRSQLLQVLVNLVRNAREAVMASGRCQGRVAVRARRVDPRQFEIAVTDDGAGIEASKIDRLFNYGFTTKGFGHGFGLHSASTFVQSIGGSIRAVSDGPGKGAEFIVTLPLKCREDGDE